MEACEDIVAQVLNIIWTICALILSLLMGYMTIILIKNHCHPNTKSHKQTKILFILGTIYAIITLSNTIFYVIHGIYWFRTCNEISKLLTNISGFLYMLQLYSLWSILFLRLYIVFQGSVYELSKYTLILFITMFILLPIIAANLFNPAIPGNYKRILLFSLFMLSIIIFLSISVLFLYKLVMIFKTVENQNENVNGKDNTFLLLITKNTILVMISISFSMINFVSVIFFPDNEQISLGYIRHFMFLFDIFTNFICVTLAYQCFKGYYDIFCGSLDRRCQVLCMRMIQHNQEIEMANVMKLQASKSMDSSPKSEK